MFYSVACGNLKLASLLATLINKPQSFCSPCGERWVVQVCADTVVGDAMLRGISGGQKKRVTSAEMLVGPKKVLFLDEISTGLVFS